VEGLLLTAIQWVAACSSGVAQFSCPWRPESCICHGRWNRCANR